MIFSFLIFFALDNMNTNTVDNFVYKQVALKIRDKSKVFFLEKYRIFSSPVLIISHLPFEDKSYICLRFIFASKIWISDPIFLLCFEVDLPNGFSLYVTDCNAQTVRTHQQFSFVCVVSTHMNVKHFYQCGVCVFFCVLKW